LPEQNGASVLIAPSGTKQKGARWFGRRSLGHETP
jgi:hypothetical protein